MFFIKVVPPRDDIKYLRLQIDKADVQAPIRGSGGGEKAARVVNQLARIVPNVGGPRESHRKLFASVAHSVLLYAVPDWGHKLETPGYRMIAIRAQRMACMPQICAYRTISANAALVIAASPPVDLATKMRRLMYQHKKAGASKQDCRRLRYQNEEAVLLTWSRNWRRNEESTAVWTRSLIRDIGARCQRRHGEVGFHMTQALSGRGCFNTYLHDPLRAHCGLGEDTPRHTTPHPLPVPGVVPPAR